MQRLPLDRGIALAFTTTITKNTKMKYKPAAGLLRATLCPCALSGDIGLTAKTHRRRRIPDALRASAFQFRKANRGKGIDSTSLSDYCAKEAPSSEVKH
jgi:hypothetical protein